MQALYVEVNSAPNSLTYGMQIRDHKASIFNETNYHMKNKINHSKK